MKMSARVVCDSMSPDNVRLTTFELVYPRIIHSEVMTHRVFSRNAASSRAIPVEKMLRAVGDDPYVPSSWGKNQKGMQAEQELSDDEKFHAKSKWLFARDSAVSHAQELLKIGVHKQLTNRLLEPFSWMTVLCTATEWDNWFHLRDHEMAHPEIQKIAHLMTEELARSTPRLFTYGSQHLPLVFDEDAIYASNHGLTADDLTKVSIGRCARVSYLTHDGKRDLNEDIKLANRLLESGHMSPFEHAARPMSGLEREFYRRDRVTLKSGRVLNDVRLPSRQYVKSINSYALVPDTWNDLFVDDPVVKVEHTHFCGNFNGWVQARKEIPREWDLMGGKQ